MRINKKLCTHNHYLRSRFRGIEFEHVQIFNNVWGRREIVCTSQWGRRGTCMAYSGSMYLKGTLNPMIVNESPTNFPPVRLLIKSVQWTLSSSPYKGASLRHVLHESLGLLNSISISYMTIKADFDNFKGSTRLHRITLEQIHMFMSSVNRGHQ